MLTATCFLNIYFIETTRTHMYTLTYTHIFICVSWVMISKGKSNRTTVFKKREKYNLDLISLYNIGYSKIFLENRVKRWVHLGLKKYSSPFTQDVFKNLVRNSDCKNTTRIAKFLHLSILFFLWAFWSASVYWCVFKCKDWMTFSTWL